MKMFEIRNKKYKENRGNNQNIINFRFKDKFIKINEITKNPFGFFKKNIKKLSSLAIISALTLNITSPAALNNMNNINKYENKINYNNISMQKELENIKKNKLMKKAGEISQHIQNLGYISSLTSQTGIYSIIRLSEKIGNELDVPWKIVFSQWAAESKYFTSYDAINKNNLASLGPHYSFKSLNDFGKAFVETIKDNFPKAMKTDSIEEYSTGLFSKFKYCTWPLEFANANGYEKLIGGTYEAIFKNREVVEVAKNINKKELNRLKTRNFG